MKHTCRKMKESLMDIIIYVEPAPEFDRDQLPFMAIDYAGHYISFKINNCPFCGIEFEKEVK